MEKKYIIEAYNPQKLTRFNDSIWAESLQDAAIKWCNENEDFELIDIYYEYD